MNNSGGMPTSSISQFSAAQLQKGIVLTLLGGTKTINSLTVDASQFTGTFTVYNGTAAQNPLYQISTGQIKTTPAGTRSLFIQSSALGTGTIYCQWTDEFLSSTTNLNQTAPVASASWTALSEGQVLSGLVHGTVADPYWGTLAYIILNNTTIGTKFTNQSNVAGTIWLQSLEVSGIPDYVTSGVFVSFSGAGAAGYAPLLTGPGRWSPVNPKVYGYDGTYVYAVFGNYDTTQQIFGLSMQYTLSGYTV